MLAYALHVKSSCHVQMGEVCEMQLERRSRLFVLHSLITNAQVVAALAVHNYKDVYRHSLTTLLSSLSVIMSTVRNVRSSPHFSCSNFSIQFQWHKEFRACRQGWKRLETERDEIWWFNSKRMLHLLRAGREGYKYLGA